MMFSQENRLEIKWYFPSFVRNISSVYQIHETLIERNLLGLKRKFYAGQKLKIMAPEMPITWVYVAFVWKMQAQISALPNLDQGLQPATPHSSLMLGNKLLVIL